jgi:hypothetical protein
MSFSLNRYGYVNPLLSPEDWQKWAEQVNIMPVVLTKNPPNPYMYARWDEWAERFCEIVGLGD